MTYSQMLDLLLDQMFAETGAIHYHLIQAGCESQIIVSNCEPLQKKWAEENGTKYSESNWKLEIALAQVKAFRPDIFYLESVFEFFGAFVAEIKPHCKMIASWISTPFSPSLPLSGIDLFLSSTPAFVAGFRNQGFKAEYMTPGFDARILKKLKIGTIKDIPFSFVGGWTNTHVNRKKAIEILVKKTPLKIWGYGYRKTFPRKNIAYFREKFFPQNKAILKVYQGEAWALKMFDVIQRSLITFNVHESLLEGYVGNMRMFEASGVGTLILNDEGHNLNQLFEVGKEIESYKTLDEAVEKANYYVMHPEKAIEMGLNAQKRTLEQYQFSHYVAHFLSHCKKVLK